MAVVSSERVGKLVAIAAVKMGGKYELKTSAIPLGPRSCWRLHMTYIGVFDLLRSLATCGLEFDYQTAVSSGLQS